MMAQSWQAFDAHRQNALLALVVENMAPYVSDDPARIAAFAAQKRVEMSAKDALFVVSAGQDAEIFGFAQFTPPDAPPDAPREKIVFVSELQIRPSQQSKGWGSALMAEILAFAVKNQSVAIMLSCNSANERALSFYRNRHGFIDMGQAAPGLWRAAQCQLVRFIDGLDFL